MIEELTQKQKDIMIFVDKFSAEFRNKFGDVGVVTISHNFDNNAVHVFTSNNMNFRQAAGMCAMAGQQLMNIGNLEQFQGTPQ